MDRTASPRAGGSADRGRPASGPVNQIAVRCHDSVLDIGAEDWRQLSARAEIEFTSEYLRYLEELEALRRPVLVARDAAGAPLAACGLAEFGTGTPHSSKPAHLLTDAEILHIDENADEIGEFRSVLARHGIQAADGMNAMLSAARRALIERAGVPAVVRSMGDSRVLTVAGLGRGARRHALAHTVIAARAEAVRRGYQSVAFVSTPADDEDLAAVLRAAGFQSALLRCIPELDLRDCGTFDDFLARFRAHARAAIRKEIRRFEQSGLVVCQVDPDAFLPQMVALEAANMRKHGSGISADLLTHMHVCLRRNLGDRVVSLGVFLDRQPVASALLLRGRRCLYNLRYGADYGAGPPPGAYAAAMCYAPVRYALEHGLETVMMGFEGYEAKVLRGAGLAERRLFIWTAKPDGTALLRDWLPIVDVTTRRYFRALREQYASRTGSAGS